MGRLVVFVLLVAGGWFLADRVGVGCVPGGVGTRVGGSEVVLAADELEARFSKHGAFEDAYMIFGGDAQQRHNSLTHATVAALAMDHARAIHASHPDFHLCKSPGAARAQRLVETLSFVAAHRAARNALIEAVALHAERVRDGGERTCVAVRGAPLQLEAVHLAAGGQDVTADVAPAFAQTRFLLAESVALTDCATLLE